MDLKKSAFFVRLHFFVIFIAEFFSREELFPAVAIGNINPPDLGSPKRSLILVLAIIYVCSGSTKRYIAIVGEMTFRYV